MEDHLEQPRSLENLAETVGLTPRQTHRLFLIYLRKSPGRFYLQLHLDEARQFLRQTSMNILDVPLVC